MYRHGRYWPTPPEGAQYMRAFRHRPATVAAGNAATFWKWSAS